MLYNLIISPIESIVELAFYFCSSFLDSLGIMGAIVAVSLVVNFLALPLYNVADDIQENERNISRRLEKGVKRIKETFKGDEQFMMLQTYYRENGYHPLYALRSSLSIMIEIPFFIAAYHFLSHCPALKGNSFWFLSDLGSPDKITAIRFAGGFVLYINILPVIMTAINLVSGTVYAKGAPLREKVQIFVLALIFLVLLYNSPSGLVVYWILNNLFSLAKNVVRKYSKKPERLVHAVISVLLLLSGIYFVCFKRNLNIAKRLLTLGFALFVCALPLLKKLTGKLKAYGAESGGVQNPGAKTDGGFAVFILSAITLSVLCGLRLPSNLISTSPAEFSFIGSTDSPLSYIKDAFFFYIGLCVVWPFAIWKMFGKKIRNAMCVIFPVLLSCAFLNAFVFKYSYGHLSVFFQLDDSSVLRNISPFYSVLPVVAMAAVIGVVVFARKTKFAKYIAPAIACVLAAELLVSFVKISEIKKGYRIAQNVHQEKNALTGDDSASASSEIKPLYHFSRNGKNVVVFFIDRAVNSLFPYIVQQFPELKEIFSGFVYYPNTVSFGNTTWCGSPAMIGGYEYTHFEKEKREVGVNEEINVLTKGFVDSGWSVTVSDPPEDSVDVQELSKNPDINTFELFERFNKKYITEHPEAAEQNPDRITRKRLPRFVLLEVLYPVLRFTYYNRGSYFSESVIPVLDDKFLGYFSSLYYMDKLTDASGDRNAFMFIGNDTPHEYSVLREPDFMPDTTVDVSKATAGFYKYKIPFYADNANDLAAYHVNAATILQISKWIRHLKDLGVYDNTRITIVSDHGSSIPAPGFDDTKSPKFYSKFNPILLYKDFNSTGELSTDGAFMTNADTLLLSVSSLGMDETNPYTGKAFSETVAKNPAHIYPAISLDEFKTEYAGDKLLWDGSAVNKVPSYYVKENIFNPDNWTPVIESR